MRLIACPSCHTQYDVSEVLEEKLTCRCGEEFENRELEAVEAQIHRCGSCGAQATATSVECDYCGATIVRDKRRLSLICPECYARNPNDARFCGACGVGFDPERVETEGVELPCPCCGCLMPIRQVGGVAVNECGECNGIWVPGEKFKLLVDQAIEARDSNQAAPNLRVVGANPLQQRVHYRKCPRCEAFMQRRNFRKVSGVIIDVCKEHGTWLDADELEAIAGYILSGGRPEAERFVADQKTAASAPVRIPAQTYSHQHVPDYESAHRGVSAIKLISFFLRLLG